MPAPPSKPRAHRGRLERKTDKKPTQVDTAAVPDVLPESKPRLDDPDSVCISGANGSDDMLLNDAEAAEFAAAAEVALAQQEDADATQERTARRVMPRQETAGALVKSRFNQSLGLVGYASAKKVWVCASCKEKEPKGTARFQLAYNLQKPSQSWHAGCVLAMPAHLRAESCKWLQQELENPSSPEFDREMFQNVLQDLNALQGVDAALHRG